MEVTAANIISWTHTKIVFYPPEGQGENKEISLTVGGQPADTPDGEPYIFSYYPPQVYNILPVADPSTDGGYPITINGTSFGVQGAAVMMSDPLQNSSNSRMEPQSCTVVSQTDTQVVCTVPQYGWGGHIQVTLTVDNRYDWYVICISL